MPELFVRAPTDGGDLPQTCRRLLEDPEMTSSARVRRSGVVVVLAGLLAGLAACGGESTAEVAKSQVGSTEVGWIYGGTPSALDVPVLKGIEAGWFADEDLEVTTTAGGEIDQLQAIDAGDADITIDSGAGMLIGQSQGMAVEAVGVVQPQSLTELICTPGTAIEADDPSSLLDRKLATSSTDLDDVVWQIWRNRNGLKGKVNEVSREAGLKLLLQGVVDCYPGQLGGAPVEAEETFGQAPVEFWYSKDIGVIGQVLEVNTDFAAQNPEAVKSFVGVYARGMQWAARHPDEALALIEKTYPDLDPTVVEADLKTVCDYWLARYQTTAGYLAMNDSTWKPTVQVLAAAGYLDPQPDLATVYTTQFLPDDPYLP